jgi:hypothetical protein
MLRQDSEEIRRLILEANATPAIASFFKSVQPVQANISSETPFVVYRLSEQPEATKDGLRNYILTLTVVAKKYDDVATGYDHLRTYIKNNIRSFQFTNGDTFYTDEQDRSYADLNFNIKIT